MEDLIMLPIMNRNQWLPTVFNDFFNTDYMPKASCTAPAINVTESDKDYTVELAAPGLKKEDFKVNINDDATSSSRWSRRMSRRRKTRAGHYLRREFSYSKYEQTLILPDDVEKEQISAKVDNGVLTIDLPKTVAAQKKPARQIDIC